jgi:CheY-like chemotaxis protein
LKVATGGYGFVTVTRVIASDHFAGWSCICGIQAESWRMVVATAGSALIVDDDPDMRALVRTVLEVEGNLTCTEAGDGFHGLEMWMADRHDVVVVDQRMPGITGIEVAGAVLEEDPDQIVILFSAYLDPRTVERALEMGVCAVVPKDDIRQLPRVIEEAIAARGAA